MSKPATATRDPRKDPRPGDVVSQGRIFNGKRSAERTVTANFGGSVSYRTYRWGRTCSLDTWREWARGADVVTVGER